MHFAFINILHIFQNPEFYEDKEELESIIKQAAKERLRLERQVSRDVVSTTLISILLCPYAAYWLCSFFIILNSGK